MWNTLAALSTADEVAGVGERCVIANASIGELLTLDPATSPAPSARLGAGWSGPSTIAGLPDGSALLLVDNAGVLWCAELSAATPPAATVLASQLGKAVQLAVPTTQTAYLLGRTDRGPPLPLRPWSPGRGPLWPLPLQLGPTLPLQPSLPARRRERIVRLDLVSRVVTTVVAGLVDAAGLAISADESTAYVTSETSGELLAVDMSGGVRRSVVGGLSDPGRCAWLDEPQGQLLVVEHGGFALVDVIRGDFRHVPGCPGMPRSVARVGDRVVVAAGAVVAAVDAAVVAPKRVVLAPPSTPIYRGGYARVAVDLGTSGLAVDDLVFDIAEGPDFAALSVSRDDLFDPSLPQVMLLAGPHPGTYTLRASDSVGTEVAVTQFEVTDRWTMLDGPSKAFTGVNPLYTSGGAWGSLFNGVFSFTYGLQPVTGQRRVALVFVNTSDATLPAGTDTLYRNALTGGVLGADNVSRSVAAYYNELSDGRLTIIAAGESTVTLTQPWGDYASAFSSTDKRWGTSDELRQQALSLAQNDIDFRTVDTAVFVVASPNGGLPTNPNDPGTSRFIWPVASGGTYIFSQPPTINWPGWWWKALTWAMMPAEWEKVDPRRAYETLTHEIGHTLGMPDLYPDSRPVGGYDVMDTDRGVPSLSLPNQIMLGWVAPSHLRTYNFRVENPVLETITLAATELVGAGPPPLGERAGAVVDIAEGWRYYFEYRSRQNVTATDTGPAQVADQSMPQDRQVIGLDVAAGAYHPPVLRTPIRLLLDDGDGQGSVLSVGEDYEELDATGNATFRLEVLSADDDRASVRVSYQPVPAPEPPWPNGPDPSIRPWPGGDDWQSPDVWVTNFSGTNVNIPWAGHDNIIAARVTNTGNSDATGVRVGFWVKDFTVSANAPETPLGSVTADIAAGSNYTFGMLWRPPAYSGQTFYGFGSAHYCLVARIAPHTQGSPPRGEVNPNNNEAQTNYTVVWTKSGSPFDRQRVPVQVANPYPDRGARVCLHAEQRLAWYRTYLEHSELTLAPGEVRTVDVMVECVAEEPAFADIVPADRLYAEPNIVSVVAAVIDSDSDVFHPIGGATIEVRASRAANLVDLDVARASISGRVVLASDGSPVPPGGNVAMAGLDPAGRDITYQGRVGRNGAFSSATPDFATLPQGAGVDVVYAGDSEVAPSATRVVLR